MNQKTVVDFVRENGNTYISKHEIKRADWFGKNYRVVEVTLSNGRIYHGFMSDVGNEGEYLPCTVRTNYPPEGDTENIPLEILETEHALVEWHIAYILRPAPGDTVQFQSDRHVKDMPWLKECAGKTGTIASILETIVKNKRQKELYVLVEGHLWRIPEHILFDIA